MSVFNNHKTAPGKQIFFRGAVGRVEGILQNAEKTRDSSIALFLHSDPLNGGHQREEVILTASSAFYENNITTLSVNARGVGKSEGVFEHGSPELLDAALALDWLENENITAKNIWVVGFSAGVWAAVQLAMRRPEITKFMLISPMVNKFDSSFFSSHPFIKGLVIQGTLDSVTDHNTILKFFDPIIKHDKSVIDFCMVKDSDHFFRDKQKDLSTVINNYIK